MQDTGHGNPALERSALIVATLTSFIGPFMISSVNVALPSIQADLRMDAVQLSWIATAYLLAVAVGLVPAGKIADIHGRKKVFATGLAVYTIGCGVAAFVDSTALLIATRVVQGMGAAMFVTTGMAILTSIFPPHRRGRVIGIYVAAVYIGLSVGPFVGGLLTQHFGWRSIFLLMLPLGIFSIVLTLYFLRGEWLGSRVSSSISAAACSTAQPSSPWSMALRDCRRPSASPWWPQVRPSFSSLSATSCPPAFRFSICSYSQATKSLPSRAWPPCSTIRRRLPSPSC